ncbi:MAG TPA: alpha/beta fold hydrolase [Telluria sp.]|jgi:homoserine O-acetyltransferase
MHTLTINDFPLASGETLTRMTVAYRTLGQLNADGTNAVLVLHGYTTGPAMIDPGASAAEGSWSELVGPGKPIDSARYFVVCPNMLGSCYGSTGPGSINPATGKPFGLDFPRIGMADIVNAQKALLDALGVRSLAAVAGPSLGAFQAFQWAISYPSMVRRVVAAVGAPWYPGALGSARAIVDQLAGAPGWDAWREQGGQAAMVEHLTELRTRTLDAYGIEAELARVFADPSERRDRIAALARAWAIEFNPGSLVTLMQAAESFDVRPQLGAIGAPVLLVLSRSDTVFSPTVARMLSALPATRSWTYVELDSDKGHMASGADAALWAGTLARFMNTDPAAWIPHGFPPALTQETP